MRAKDKRAVVVIGIGNEYRSDDGAGLAVARRLEETPPPETRVLEKSGEGTSLIEAWNDAHTVFVIDAVQWNGKPGSLYRWNAKRESIPGCFLHCSTHAFSLPDALELARVLHRLPHRVVIYGIEGKSFETGRGLSPEVSAAVEETVGCLRRDLQRCRGTRRHRREGSKHARVFPDGGSHTKG